MVHQYPLRGIDSTACTLIIHGRAAACWLRERGYFSGPDAEYAAPSIQGMCERLAYFELRYNRSRGLTSDSENNILSVICHALITISTKRFLIPSSEETELPAAFVMMECSSTVLGREAWSVR